MKYLLLLMCLVYLSFPGQTQNLSGLQVLNAAIKYHDPNNQWNQFEGQFYINQTTPDRPPTQTKIKLNNPKHFFEFTLNKMNHKIQYTVTDQKCNFKCDDMSIVSDSLVKLLKLDKERGKRIRNYYTYLWGLPMKLKDPGTIVSPACEIVNFHSDKVYKLKITYDPEVGKDIWYFYFDINTFEMKAYEFFHDNSKNGEYILLDEQITIQGIKIPKKRSWYAHKKNLFLGEDVLSL